MAEPRHCDQKVKIVLVKRTLTTVCHGVQTPWELEQRPRNWNPLAASAGAWNNHMRLLFHAEGRSNTTTALSQLEGAIFATSSVPLQLCCTARRKEPFFLSVHPPYKTNRWWVATVSFSSSLSDMHRAVSEFFSVKAKHFSFWFY